MSTTIITVIVTFLTTWFLSRVVTAMETKRLVEKMETKIERRMDKHDDDFKRKVRDVWAQIEPEHKAGCSPHKGWQEAKMESVKINATLMTVVEMIKELREDFMGWGRRHEERYHPIGG